MKKLFSALLFSFILMVILTGCGRSIEKDLIGAWKFTREDEKSTFMEFSEERLVLRNDLDDAPETVDYRLTNLQKGKFIIEVVEPGTNTYIFFFEGEFDKKDKIKVTKAMDADDKTFELIKVKDLDKEMEKERKKQEELAAKKEKERAEKEKEEKKKAKKEKAEKEEKEKAEAEKAKTKESDAIKDNKNGALEEQVGQAKETKTSNNITQDNGLKAQYLRAADRLDEEIMNEAMKTYPNDQDMRYGFYGHYYTEWDDLLNEIWGILKDSMSANEFEQVKADQIKWIQQKEKSFAEYPDDVASSRAMGMDYLAIETKERVYYLIENHLK